MKLTTTYKHLFDLTKNLSTLRRLCHMICLYFQVKIICTIVNVRDCYVRSAATFTNWGKTEPDKGPQASVKDCGVLAVNVDNGTWATQNCSYQQPYVCKRNRGRMK